MPRTMLFACSYFWAALILTQTLKQKPERRTQGVNITEEPFRTFVPGITRRIITDVKDGGHRLVEISQDTNGKVLDCNAFGDKKFIDTVLGKVPESAITKVTVDKMETFVDLCHNRELNNTKGGPESIFDFLGHVLHRFTVWPETKWCDEGTLATSYDDLGMDKAADMCCRDHDHSTDSIGAFQTKHGITNSRLYTMTNCQDDCKLYNCLQKANSPVSNALGMVYFDVLKSTCFSYDHPLK